jgi:predicted HicB family RNase H-like nuclease
VKNTEKKMDKVAYRKKIHIRLDDDLHRKLRMKVANEATTIQTYITNLLRNALG